MKPWTEQVLSFPIAHNFVPPAGTANIAINDVKD